MANCTLVKGASSFVLETALLKICCQMPSIALIKALRKQEEKQLSIHLLAGYPRNQLLYEI